MIAIVDHEGPIHTDFAFNRIASVYDQRRGARIETRLMESLNIALSENRFRKTGQFLHKEDLKIVVRNREEFKLTADFIHPEEIQACIRMVVEAATMIPHDKLIAEVIAVMGLVRNPVSKKEIEKHITYMRNNKILGEGSAGLALLI